MKKDKQNQSGKFEKNSETKQRIISDPLEVILAGHLNRKKYLYRMPMIYGVVPNPDGWA